MAQKGFMRTIEETRAHIKALHDEIENGDVGARHNGPNCPGCLYSLLEFIDSEPPCKHLKLLFWHGRVLCPGDLPSGWYYVRQNNNTASDSFKFCPDCGEELPAEGLA